MMVTMVT